MDKATFVTVDGWWLVESSAPSDVEALRKELEPALGSGWHESKDKLEALYDALAAAGLVDELDSVSDSGSQAVWVGKAAGAAKTKQEPAAPVPAAGAPDGQAHAVGDHPAGEHSAGEHEEPSVPDAPPLTEEEIKSIAAEAGIDPADLEGIDLSEIEAEDVDVADEDEDEAG